MPRKYPTATVNTQVKCPNCGREYRAGAPHRMFCPATHCRNCGTNFGYVLPVYDSRPEALDEDGLPERRCEKCLDEVEDS